MPTPRNRLSRKHDSEIINAALPLRQKTIDIGVRGCLGGERGRSEGGGC
jgi:hypothetical protein